VSTVVAQGSAPARYMQGISVPANSVNPNEFFARTRRKFQTEASKTFNGLGGTDVFEIKKTDILSGLFIRFDGSLTIALPTGTAATTARWPMDLIKAVRFTANGQSNLINCSGAKLKLREVQSRGDLSDRGVSQSVNGVTVTQGTLSQAHESWGVGSRATAIPAATYDLDLDWFVPIAEDQVDLAGAIFAASSSTDLTLTIEWANSTDLFTLTGTATAAVTGTVTVSALRYAIPLGADGQIVVPDLSTFHQLIQSSTSAISNGENEVRLSGQGAGKTLLRASAQLWNGAATAPVQITEDNFGRLAWRYSGNETPDEYFDGQTLRMYNERQYNSDVGAIWGFHCHEFAAENAFRDTVDLGTTSEWRLVVAVQSGVTLVSPRLEILTESIFSAGAGA
jgi:hypothetical protein